MEKICWGGRLRLLRMFKRRSAESSFFWNAKTMHSLKNSTNQMVFRTLTKERQTMRRKMNCRNITDLFNFVFRIDHDYA